MVQSRSMTSGNMSTELSRLKENIKSVNPLASTTLRNAVAKNGRNPGRNELTSGQERNIIQPHKLERLSNILANNINAADDLRAITPYIDRAELIWSSLLLYPNGEKKEDIITYSTKPSKRKNSVLHNSLLKIWKEYYTNDYKIEDELRPMVDDMLWNTGSHATLTLSRLNIDYLINGMEIVGREGKESLTDQSVFQATNGNYVYDKTEERFKVINTGKYVLPPTMDKLAAHNMQGMESFFGKPTGDRQVEFDILKGTKLDGTGFKITLSDNPSLLADKFINDKRKEFNEHDYSGNESFGSLIKSMVGNDPTDGADKAIQVQNDEDLSKSKKGTKKPKDPVAKTTNLDMSQINSIQNDLFPYRRAPQQFIQFVKQDIDFNAENYGTPIEFHVPSSAIIPVHINGNVKKQKDFIILFDQETGEFLNPVNDFQFYQSNKKNNDNITNKNTQGSTNSIIENLKTIQQGKDCDFDMTDFSQLTKSLLIEQFTKSILSGRSGSISIELDEEVNKIFLARMFRGQGIRCLYVPGEHVTYAAFKYSRLGLGQSLTQSAKMHIARLAAMDLADTMANMEMAQSTNKMRIAIDKDDPTPEATIAIAREVFFRANPRFYNVLATSQMSIPILVDAFKELSLTLEIDAGDNPHLPVPQITVEPMERQNFRRVDNDSRNEVLNKISNYFFLPKSWLDVGDDNNNFQIEALTEHRLVYNQAVNWQEMLCGFIIERERKNVKNNRPLLKELIECIQENQKLWVSDGDEEIEAKDSAAKIEIILQDFINTITCNLPVPSAMENANKIKDGLATTTDLVEQWFASSGKIALIKKSLDVLGMSEQFDDETITNLVKADLFKRAHKLLNIPSPFEESTDDGAGGIASIVESIVQQTISSNNFASKLIERQLEEQAIFLKESYKPLKAAKKKFADAQTKYGSESEEEEEETPPDDTSNLGDNPPDDTPPESVEPGSDETPPDDTVTTTSTEEEKEPGGEETKDEQTTVETPPSAISDDASGVKDPFK